MKKFLALLALLLSFPIFSNAQVAVQTKILSNVGVQAPPAAASYIVSLPNKTKQGNTLIAIIPSYKNPVLSESGNTWTQICNGVWTAPTLGTVETITVTYAAEQSTSAVFAEYSGQYVFDACASVVSGTGTTGLSNALTTTAGELVLGYGWNWTTNYDGITPGLGFVMEAFAHNSFLEDSTQVSAGLNSTSVSWSSSVNWTQGIASFKPVVPPLPAIVLSVNSGSSAVYDDASAILPGPVMISQLQNSTTTVGIGVITSDASGNLSGSLTVNPNWTDANGNLTFLFGLPAVPNVISYPVPVGEFQHNSTGLTINLVLFKQGALAIKSQTLAVTP